MMYKRRVDREKLQSSIVGQYGRRGGSIVNVGGSTTGVGSTEGDACPPSSSGQPQTPAPAGDPRSTSSLEQPQTAAPSSQNNNGVFDVAPELVEEDDCVPESVSKDAIASTCNSVRSDPKSMGKSVGKRKKCYATMSQVKAIVAKKGNIQVEYDEFTRGPLDHELHGQLTSSIGCIILSKVHISAYKWEDIPESEKKKVVDGLTPYFDIDWSDERIFNWVHDHAKFIFKDYKSDFSRHYRTKGLDNMPDELVHREAEWKFLCEHFEKEDFKRSFANIANRKVRQVEHKTGRMPIVYRVKHYKEQGKQFPVIPAYEDSYDCVNNEVAAGRLQRMNDKADDFMRVREEENMGVDSAEVPPVEWSTNIDILEAGLGRRRGKEVRGLGQAGVRDITATSSRQRPIQHLQERLSASEVRAQEVEARAQQYQVLTEKLIGQVDRLQQTVEALS